MSTIIIAVDSREPDRLFASAVKAMRKSLGVTVTELALASGIPCSGIEAIESGGGASQAHRRCIAAAVRSLSERAWTVSPAPRPDAFLRRHRSTG